ncbi:MAG: hypothetical protein MN733_20820 [Nitrososphaera sp.]|nr:hypothetical protein [Nitrososphaera sp.]
MTTTKSIHRSIREHMLPVGDVYNGCSQKTNTSHHKGPLIMLGKIITDLCGDFLQKTTQKRYIPEINIYIPTTRAFSIMYVKQIAQIVQRRFTKSFASMSVDDYLGQVSQTASLGDHQHTDVVLSIANTLLEGLERGQASNVRIRVNPRNKVVKVSKAIMSDQVKVTARRLYDL